MTSEIRANTIKNRVGLGTVSITDSGTVVSGIVTANSFSGPFTGDLDVDGHTNLDNVSISGVSTFSGAITADSTLYVGSDLTITDKIVHNGDTNTAIRFPAADTVSVETAGSERLRITSDGKIGINETNPDSELEINRGSEGKYMTVGGDDASNGRALSFTSSEGGTGSNGALHTINAKSGNGAIALATAGTERLRIDSSGNLTLSGTSSSSDPRFTLRHSNADVEGEVLRLARTDNNAIRYHSIKAMHGGAATNNYITFNLHDGTSGSGYTAQQEVLRIRGDRNVGIASAIPQARLDVFATNGTIAQFGDPRSASFECIRIKNNVAGYPAISQDSTPDTLELRSMGSVQASIDANNNDTGNYFRVVANGQAGSGTEIFRVQENGNVGINTNSPSATLEVKDIGSSSPCVLIRGATSSEGDVTVPDGETFNFGHWNYTSSTFTERLRIDPDGRMGLGLTPHTSDVATNITEGLFQTDRNIDIRYPGTNSDPAGARYLNFINTDTTLVAGQPMGGLHWIGMDSDNPNTITAAILADCSGNGGTASHLLFKTGGSERLRIRSDGNVGVGDYSSTNLTHAFQALRTSGSTYVSSKNTGGNAVFYAEASTGNTAKLELMQAGVGNFTLEVGSDNALMFKDDGTERLRLGHNGVVHVNSVAGGQAVVAFGDPTGNSFQAQNRIGGDTIFVADESISSAISLPRNGCFAVITAYSDTNGNYPQPNTSCMVYIDCGPSRNIKLCDFGSNVGYDVSTKNAYTSTVSDCDNGKLTVMAGDTQGTFRLVNRESNNDYYYQITFI